MEESIIPESNNDNENTREKSSSSGSIAISGGSIVSLIDSITKDAEEKVLLEDNIKGIIREAETLDSYIHDMPADQRKKLLLAYSKILEEIRNNIENMVKQQ